VPEGRQGRESALDSARALVRAALASLEADRGRIDNLNVFPVPDGDTGTNMALTVRSVAEALAASSASAPDEVASEVTRACLMGARGNSGVILSQLVRGAADALARGEPLAAVLRRASDAGYAAVREPQEGTILTVARAVAERAEELDAGVPLGESLVEVVTAGEAALARTQEQLAPLREAGVVDAGAAGLLALVRGVTAQVRGEPLPEAAAAPERLPLDAVHRELSRYRYCTSFFVEGEDVDPDRLEHELGELGDSLLVVGSAGAVKIHLHTDEPGRALSLATATGVVEEVDIKNMHVQTVQRSERLAAATERAVSDVVAVCAGAGNARLFRNLGAAVIVEGGDSVDPATSELAAAIESAGADEVLLLPNNQNVVMTAEQAAASSQKRVRVVPTTSLQAGLGAMVAFDGLKTADENAAEMESAARLVRAGAVTRASGAAVAGELAIEQGEFLGLIDGKAVASGPVLHAVARDVIERLLVDGSDVLTILVGEEATATDALRDEIEAAYPQLEVEIHEGGQPHFPLLLAVE
jgi:uncharacterized protein